MAATKVDQELDARGLLCPMPIVKTAKAMKELGGGGVLKLLATDRGAITDVSGSAMPRFSMAALQAPVA